MKSRLFVTILAAVGVGMSAVGQQGRDIVVVVKDEPIIFADAKPIMMGSRVMVPMRGVFERMGAHVMWVPEQRMVVAHEADGTETARLWVGKTVAQIDNRSVTIDAAPVVRGGRTYVPLRFLSEALGAKVDWDADTYTVTIIQIGAR